VPPPERVKDFEEPKLTPSDPVESMRRDEFLFD
jgi:hypothetical protein